MQFEEFDKPESLRVLNTSPLTTSFKSAVRNYDENKFKIVFLFKPSGASHFEKLTNLARALGYEVGYDPIEEKQNHVFSTRLIMEEESEDSLDLLLDTLCNAFGGIILITLLIALMSQEANEAPELPESFQAEWMLEQQEVSRIENELIIEQAIQENLLKYVKDKPVQVNTSLLKQKKDLEQKKIVEIANIKSLREELESLPVNSTNLALDLENKLKRLRESKFDTANLKDDQEMKIESLQSKLPDVQKEISATKSERTLALRLPKEKKRSGKTYEWVVIKHGLIYPLNYPDRSKILTEIEDSPTDTIYIPKPGKA